MTFRELLYLIRSDLWRYSGRATLRAFLWNWLVNPGFVYSSWLRLCAYLKGGRLTRLGCYQISRLILHHYAVKYGISIPPETRVGPGFYIGHFGTIVINPNSVIGRNCNISQGVTLGQANRGKRVGAPVIGDNVYIGPGAKIIGHVIVGNGVAIGANCVVTHDVPDNAVVVGVPGKVISQDGSQGYVNRVDY